MEGHTGREKLTELCGGLRNVTQVSPLERNVSIFETADSSGEGSPTREGDWKQETDWVAQFIAF